MNQHPDPPTPRIVYTLAMPRPHTHLFHVTLDVVGLSGPAHHFVLPTWTPGSYMLREYARHVQEFDAMTGDSAAPHALNRLPWRKVAKDTWRVETQGATQVRICYQVYAHELTVRTSHLDDTHGYANGATVFMYLPERTSEPHGLIVRTPEGRGWQVATGLEPWPHAAQAAPDQHAFIAEDYDELVDCPLECGTHRLRTFEVDGIAHHIAIWGHGNEDADRLVADTQRIVETARTFFGGLPYPHYTFILHLATGYGGLEHRNSVTNLLDRWTFQPDRSYERFLKLQSHEFFHVWNVKRIRPAPLGPFDYQQENYTRMLWAMEGATAYYDRLLLVRAGLLTPARYLEILAEDILKLQRTPGRALQSLEASSFDAWIKFYRPDEHSANSSVSYYLKGSLVMLLLDLELRQRTDGAHSLDDVLRYLAATYPISGPGIPEEDGYLAAVEAVAGSADGAYRALFAHAIAGTGELDYATPLDAVGLQLEWGYSTTLPTPETGQQALAEPPAWLGLETRNEHGRLLVSSLRSDGPAYSGGIYAGDELIALDRMRIDAVSLGARLSEHRPGDQVVLSLFRRDELLHIPIGLAAAPYDTLKLVRSANPTPQQERLYADWLKR